MRGRRQRRLGRRAAARRGGLLEVEIELTTVVVDAKFVTMLEERGDRDLRKLGVMLVAATVE